MQPPRYHPRASIYHWYIYLIEGSVQTYIITENSRTLVTNFLILGKNDAVPRWKFACHVEHM
jgi:hypothetical protein